MQEDLEFLIHPDLDLDLDLDLESGSRKETSKSAWCVLNSWSFSWIFWILDSPPPNQKLLLEDHSPFKTPPPQPTFLIYDLPKLLLSRTLLLARSNSKRVKKSRSNQSIVRHFFENKVLQLVCNAPLDALNISQLRLSKGCFGWLFSVKIPKEQLKIEQNLPSEANQFLDTLVNYQTLANQFPDTNNLE